MLLFVAILITPPLALANFVIKDRDYQAVTFVRNADDEALYILDGRSGQMACFSYNPAQRTLVLRDLKPIMNAFAAIANAGPACRHELRMNRGFWPPRPFAAAFFRKGCFC